MLHRLLRMDETGLLFRWQQGTSVDGSYCIQKIQRVMNEQFNSGDKKRLTLKDLSGAFVVLGVGYAIGIAVFIMEHYYSRNVKKRKAIVGKNTKPVRNTNKSPTKNQLKTQKPTKEIQPEPPKVDEITHSSEKPLQPIPTSEPNIDSKKR